MTGREGWNAEVMRLAKGAARRLRRLLPRRTRPAILMYHRIARDTFDPWGLAVEEERFLEQLQWLAQNRTVMPLTEFAERHRERRLPADAISLTFDDGYACSVTTAAPLLERLGLPATIFLPADLIESGREFWWDELARIVMELGGESLTLDEDTIPVPARDERDRLWLPGAPPATPRQALFHALWSKLRTRRPAELGAAMSRLRSQSAIEASPRKSHRPLSATEARAAASTLEFGSHALNHPSLPVLDAEEKAREIGQSRSRCAALTGAVPASFAYPYGDLDTASMHLVQQAGFACACATGNAFVSRRSNSFALPRLHVGNWDLRRFTDMLAGR